MSDRLWHRLAAACGAGAVVFLIVGNEVSKIEGASPGLHDSPQEYVDAVGTPAATVVGGSLIVLGLCLFVPFFAALARRLEEAGGGRTLASIVLGGGLVTVAVGIFGAPPLFAAGVLADDGQLDPVVAKALQLMNAGSFIAMWATSAISVAAVSALVLRTRALPRSIGWAGVVLAPGLLAASVAVWKYEAATIVWLLTLLWIIAISVALAVRAGRPESVAREHQVAAKPAA